MPFNVKYNIYIVFSLLIFFLSACGEGINETKTPQNQDNKGPVVEISGTVTYDFVPGSARGLDYDNISRKPVRGTVVQLLNKEGRPVATTITDNNGRYSATVPENTDIKVRVLAKLYKNYQQNWHVQVVDNTRGDALYVSDGSLAHIGTSSQIRNLNIPSGWDGDSYSSKRAAAPFAMLDTIYTCMQLVLSADPTISFPFLKVNWSVNNVAASGSISLGQIGTSSYYGGQLYILGDADHDTDEYDDHVIAHEWGHYYEDIFSRSDSIGGSHGFGQMLDIRLAFGEGWGNAFSAMALNDPVYYDTSGSQQSRGFSVNIDRSSIRNPGWFNESSIQGILYDLYDSGTDESFDTLSLGFGPIHQVMTGAEKNVGAFTSIFSFITLLKKARPDDATAIDTIVRHESIARITDIFGGLDGAKRTNHKNSYPYTKTTGSSHNQSARGVSTSTSYGTPNKLGNRRYIRFKINTNGNYTITVNGSNRNSLGITLYQITPSLKYIVGKTSSSSQVRIEHFFKRGSYLIDLGHYYNPSSGTYNITIR
ncbi:MAG: hypothetical protein LGB06_01515 [Sulfurovum sp.]|nr:hypothetical protein [Sulfurovum sp.]